MKTSEIVQVIQHWGQLSQRIRIGWNSTGFALAKQKRQMCRCYRLHLIKSVVYMRALVDWSGRPTDSLYLFHPEGI